MKNLVTGKDGSRVSPYCGKPHCLPLNPKANSNNDWTVEKKQERKRKASGAKLNPKMKKPKQDRKRNPSPFGAQATTESKEEKDCKIKTKEDIMQKHKMMTYLSV